MWGGKYTGVARCGVMGIYGGGGGSASRESQDIKPPAPRGQQSVRMDASRRLQAWLSQYRVANSSPECGKGLLFCAGRERSKKPSPGEGMMAKRRNGGS